MRNGVKPAVAAAIRGLIAVLALVWWTAAAIAVQPGPVVTALTPNKGTVYGVPVTVTGSGFTGATSVMFGSQAATDVVVVDDNTITLTTPANAVWKSVVDVIVTAPGGTSDPGPTFDFGQFGPQPSVASITPSQGGEAGGVTVTIKGSIFLYAAAVQFGGVQGGDDLHSGGGTLSPSFTVIDDNTIEAVVPPGTGTVDIYVYGASYYTNCACGVTPPDFLPATYTYVPVPAVTKLTRNGGATAGGESVVLAGTGFTGTTAVSFGGTPATSFNVDSDTQITAVTPAGTGNVNVTVTTTGGISATGAGNRFYYGAPAPTISAIAPPYSPMAGNDGVAILGSGLTGTTQVLFGSTPAIGFSVDNDGLINVIEPPGTGVVDVTVEAPGGSVTVTDAFRYVVGPAASSISPDSGPEEGGTVVTITGSGFEGSYAQVYFGSNEAYGLDVVVNSDTSLTVTSPPGIGAVDVTVVTRGGTTAGAPFTYVPSGPPQDSLNAELVQKQLTRVVANTSGRTIAGAVAKGISQGFSGGSSADFGLMSESAFMAYGPEVHRPDPFSDIVGGPGQIFDPSGQWNAWVDVQGSGLLDGGSGRQLNVTAGVGYRFSKDFIAGIVGGQESFSYSSTAPNGLLTGNGLSTGVYTGWRFSRNGRFDAALVWTGLGYDVASGAATGQFNASRWLLTSGLTGDFELTENLTVSPSARIYALWESQEGWTDSLATAHAARAFSNGTISAGATFSGEWMLLDDMTIRPYFGGFADYGFDNDGTTTTSTLAARIKAGLKLNLSDSTTVDIGGELAGLASSQRTWSLNAGINGRF